MDGMDVFFLWWWFHHCHDKTVVPVEPENGAVFHGPNWVESPEEKLLSYSFVRFPFESSRISADGSGGITFQNGFQWSVPKIDWHNASSPMYFRKQGGLTLQTWVPQHQEHQTWVVLEGRNPEWMELRDVMGNTRAICSSIMFYVSRHQNTAHLAITSRLMNPCFHILSTTWSHFPKIQPGRTAVRQGQQQQGLRFADGCGILLHHGTRQGLAGWWGARRGCCGKTSSCRWFFMMGIIWDNTEIMRGIEWISNKRGEIQQKSGE